MSKEIKYELGRQAKDIITGFTGVLSGFCRHLTGCDTYGITPPMKKDGTLAETMWFDVNRIKILKGKRVVINTTEDKGSMSHPSMY